MLPASSLFDHLETAHGVFLREPNFYYEKKESRFIFNKSLVKISEHDVERRQRRKTVSWTNWLSIQNPNKVIFAVHFLFHTELRLAKAFVKNSWVKIRSNELQICYQNRRSCIWRSLLPKSSQISG